MLAKHQRPMTARPAGRTLAFRYAQGETMLNRPNLFGKRDDHPPVTPASSTTIPTARPAPAVTLRPGGSPSGAGQGASETADRPKPEQKSESKGEPTGGSRLIVGPDVKLKGAEILDCDTLVVEGRVEATMVSRAIQIAEHGAFKGSADIEVAEIRGTYEGELTVRGRLVVHATGRVSGKVRYGKLLVQEGGEITGEVGTLAGRTAAGAA